MLIFCVVFILIALWGLLLFEGSKLFCILMLLTALVGAVLCLLPWKKIRRISIVLAPLCLVFCVFMGQTVPKGGTAEYRSQIREAMAQIDKGKPDKGMKILDELDKKYGVTDLSIYGRVEAYLSVGEYAMALTYADTVQNQSNEYWYKYMEKILCAQGTAESQASLEELYLTGAEELPDNGYMQYMAGLVKLSRGSYQGAAYYFRNAMKLEEENALPCYYLGVICYEQGKKEEAESYFVEALERGLEEEKAVNISWYMQ